MKEQIKNGWQKVKDWIVEHRAAIVIGGTALVASAIGAVIVAKNSSHEKEGEKILGALEASVGEDEDDYENVDRYMVDKDIVDLLPAGTYDVFDSYRNERVDYVIEEKG